MKIVRKAVVKAAKELIEEYRSIAVDLSTMEETPSLFLAVHLRGEVGFGSTTTCGICKVAQKLDIDCSECIYPETTVGGFAGLISCVDSTCDIHESYDALFTDESEDPKVWSELVTKRADYLENRIKRIESGDLNKYLEK